MRAHLDGMAEEVAVNGRPQIVALAEIAAERRRLVDARMGRGAIEKGRAISQFGLRINRNGKRSRLQPEHLQLQGSLLVRVAAKILHLGEDSIGSKATCRLLQHVVAHRDGGHAHRRRLVREEVVVRIAALAVGEPFDLHHALHEREHHVRIGERWWGWRKCCFCCRSPLLHGC